MADPGDTQQGLAVIGSSYTFHGVASRGPVGRIGIADAPDIAAALEADVELAIWSHSHVANKPRTIHRRAIGENGCGAVKDPHLGLCIDNGSARLRGRRHEFKTGPFFNSGN